MAWSKAISDDGIAHLIGTCPRAYVEQVRSFADDPGDERAVALDAFKSYLDSIPSGKRFGGNTYFVKDVVGRSGFGIGSAGLLAYIAAVITDDDEVVRSLTRFAMSYARSRPGKITGCSSTPSAEARSRAAESGSGGRCTGLAPTDYNPQLWVCKLHFTITEEER